MFGLFETKSLDDFHTHLTREFLIKSSRLLIVDDQRPDLLDDLKQAGFSVDLDQSGEDLSKAERGLYDLLILDFAGVGKKFGGEEGLAILRHLKRINPSLFILSYTSKALTSQQSDFFRLTDGTLKKDAGVQESLEKIEESLREALSLPKLWKATLELLEIPETSTEAKDLQRVLVKSLEKQKFDKLKDALTAKVGKTIKNTIIENVVDKMVTTAIKAKLGIL